MRDFKQFTVRLQQKIQAPAFPSMACIAGPTWLRKSPPLLTFMESSDKRIMRSENANEALNCEPCHVIFPCDSLM
jgi:hypothetical protein